MLHNFFASLPFRTTRRDDAEARINLVKRRAWFDGEGSGEGGTGNSGDEENAKPNQQNTGTSSGQKDGNNAGEHEQRVTMPLADLNDRVQRAKQAAVNDLLKELGMDNADNLKGALKRLADIDEAGKTELEKAQSEAERLKGELEKAQQELEAERQQYRLEKRNALILEKASKLGAKNPRTALIVAEADYPDLLAKTMSEDGKVNAEAADKLLNEVVKANRELFSVNPSIPSNSGGKVSKDSKAVRDAARRNTARMLRG